MFELLTGGLARLGVAFVVGLTVGIWTGHTVTKSYYVVSEATAYEKQIKDIERAIDAGRDVDTTPDGLHKDDGYKRD